MNMGLDISVYEKVELVEAVTFDQLKAKDYDHPLFDDDEHFHVSVDHEEYRDRSPLPEGFYKKSGASDGFRAGSYSGYNRWRAELARLVGTTDRAVWNGFVPPAFGELIHFSDCEGTLKSEVCAKLAKDFADWQERAEAFAKTQSQDDQGWWLRMYGVWRKAFELAANGGAVDFH